ncbi:MAG: DUF11 domain-containing protein [Anaerolineae bacterium]
MRPGPAGRTTCALGNLPAGASTSFDVYTTIGAAVAPGTYVNAATASSPTPDPAAANNTDSAAVAVVARADLKITKFTASPAGPVPARTPILYTLYVDNLGPSAATGVQLTDAITSNGAFVVNSIASDRPATCAPATPTAPATSALVACSLTGALEPQSVGAGRWTVTVSVTANNGQTLNNLATVKAATPDPNLANNMDMASRSVTDLADLYVDKSGPFVVPAGAPAAFTIAVGNLGPSTATNVVLYDDLPPGLIFDGASADGGGSCALVPTNRVRCSWPSIPSGAGHVATVLVHVDPSVADGTVIHNPALVSSDAPDPNVSNNADSHPITIVAFADLAIQKTDFPDAVIAGNPLAYQLIVRNNGPSTAVNTVVSDPLPSQVAFASASVPGGSCAYSPAYHTVTCSLGAMAPGEVRTVTVNVVVKPNTPPSTIVNTGTVRSDTTDPNTDDNVESEPTDVVTRADLKIEKSADPVTAVAGDLVKWIVSVTNLGPSDAQAVQVVDTLPVGFTFVADTDACVQGPVGTLTCSLGTLSAGASTSFEIHTIVGAGVAPGTYTNAAAVSSPTQDRTARTTRTRPRSASRRAPI